MPHRYEPQIQAELVTDVIPCRSPAVLGVRVIHARILTCTHADRTETFSRHDNATSDVFGCISRMLITYMLRMGMSWLIHDYLVSFRVIQLLMYNHTAWYMR